jgi:hypothetical protein
VVFLMQRYSA